MPRHDIGDGGGEPVGVAGDGRENDGYDAGEIGAVVSSAHGGTAEILTGGKRYGIGRPLRHERSPHETLREGADGGQTLGEVVLRMSAGAEEDDLFSAQGREAFEIERKKCLIVGAVRGETERRRIIAVEYRRIPSGGIENDRFGAFLRGAHFDVFRHAAECAHGGETDDCQFTHIFLFFPSLIF